MESVTGTTTSSDYEAPATQDERSMMLALSILDHRAAVRDQYTGAARDAFIAKAISDAVAALSGYELDEIAAGRLRPRVTETMLTYAREVPW